MLLPEYLILNPSPESFLPDVFVRISSSETRATTWVVLFWQNICLTDGALQLKNYPISLESHLCFPNLLQYSDFPNVFGITTPEKKKRTSVFF